SGGEQKRIAIGQELMSVCKPTFLFLDEPTTGLDSVSTFEVVNALKRLTVKHRITVIASIHVPNDETLRLFDQIYLLAKGGVCIFARPPATLESSSDLESILKIKLSADYKPIEALMKLACDTVENSSKVLNLAKISATDSITQIDNEINSLRALTNGLPQKRQSFSLSQLAIHLSRQVRLVFIANFTNYAI